MASAGGFCAPGIAAEIPPAVSLGRDDRLHYVSDAQGNRVPDFSHAGYRGGGVPLPDAPVRRVMAPAAGDAGARIQAAIDHVATLSPDAMGMRGVVLLENGRYEIAASLRLDASGIVLRGEGKGPGGTVLVATGLGRRTLIEIGGRQDRQMGVSVGIVGEYVPVGARTLRVTDVAPFRVGSRVRIGRPSPREWLQRLGMDDAPSRPALVWRPGTLNLAWDRVVVAVDGFELTLDAPITTALERSLGGGTVAPYEWPGRIREVGLENFRCESEFDRANPEDEEHAWMAISIDAAEDVWIRDVVAAHFVSSAVDVRSGALRVTVQDCASVAPVSEIAGYRRIAFQTAGQLTLFQRCESEEGQHDFTVGYLAAGPNVFVDCEARRAHGFSGSIGSWASGALFDNVKVDRGALQLDNLEDWNQEVGWAAANSVLWQSVASRLICRTPPGAQNWAIGVWSQFAGNGRWSALNEFVRPDSLYRGQLRDRLGVDALAALEVKTYAMAAAAVRSVGAAIAAPTPAWASGRSAKTRGQPTPDAAASPLALAGGWLVVGDRLLVGGQIETPTWQGHLLSDRAPARGPALTRFAPGRTGLGWTDDLEELGTSMRAGNTVALRHHWGLWYDRRRDDHQMVRRIDGDVWPPFFEQPWARTGPGKTWNGLKRYDLTKFNPWYFARLRQFAGVARARGLVLVNEMYFQHNILEAGAHWADFPWRPENCIQETGFPEPPPYVGGKRIFMAELFYDVAHPVRRELHRAYIRQCLENLAEESNVVHTVGDEFTGPLAFVEFWLDVVAEWMRETRRRPLLALSTTKDVQDAILEDAQRRQHVSILDLKYWWRTEVDLHAPAGGANLSPRQHERLWKGGRPTPNSIARMGREYRLQYPHLAVITGLAEADGWSWVAAGGSLPKLPATTDPALLAALARMQPMEKPAGNAVIGPWHLATVGREYFAFAPHGGTIGFDVGSEPGRFAVHRIDLQSGRIAVSEPISGQGRIEIVTTKGEAAALWVVKLQSDGTVLPSVP